MENIFMKGSRFHPPERFIHAGSLDPIGRLGSVLERGSIKEEVDPRKIHPGLRVLTVTLTALLFLTSGPPLLAMNAIQAFGGAAGGGKASSANLQNAGAASASLNAARAKETVKQTTAALNAMQAMQARARALANSPGGVANGLNPGGLVPYYNATHSGNNGNGVPSSWNGVASLASSGNDVTVTQNTQSAYLYWSSFNVGPKTTLNFLQSGNKGDPGSWIAFNKVMGNSANPTQILGAIKSPGQVYILNQNGIIFGHGAQVNTHTLVASTLPMNENLAGDYLNGIKGRGIANNPDYQFLFSALPLDPGKNGPTAGFTPTISAPLGNVVVESGASIVSPESGSGTGGLVALIAPNVRNEGTISTPQGQTILAAGLQVALIPHPSSDPSLRGLDVTIGKVSDQTLQTIDSITGSANNSGLIQVPEGSVTMAGKAVQQNGVIDSSTSVSLNGRIDLLANYGATMNASYTPPDALGTLNNGPPFFQQLTGDVEMGPGSVMRILPEWGSSATVIGNTLALNSVVDVIGKQVTLGNGAILEAPGAITTPKARAESGSLLQNGVTINAGEWFNNASQASQFVFTDGQITLGRDAVIDVAGSTDVQVDSSQNFITLQLRSNELANSPLQRTGAVRGANITIDARFSGTYNGQYWIGTPLGDTIGFVGLIERSVAQLTEQGGSVSLAAGDTVAMATGSSINVSGGWAQYSEGNFKSTFLMYQGHLVNISQATPDRVYSGVYSSGATIEKSSKWGVTHTYDSPLDPTLSRHEASYIAGAAGGSVAIQAPSLALDGTLLGATVTGPRQIRTSASLSTLPGLSSLNLTFSGQSIIAASPVSASLNPPSLVLTKGSAPVGSIGLSTDLVNADGFGNLSILNHDGSITLPSSSTLNLKPTGQLALEAANVDIEGTISAPGGSVSLTGDLVPYSLYFAGSQALSPILDVLQLIGSGEKVLQIGASKDGKTSYMDATGILTTVPTDQLALAQAGNVSLGQNARISTAGTLVNDLPTSSSRDLQTVALNGGVVTINGYQVNLEKGGMIDVSGGALLNPSGATIYGNAGTIGVNAGQANQFVDIHNGSLQLGATFLGIAGPGASAGSLSFSAPAFQIGGPSAPQGVTQLNSSFFNQGGFGSFSLTGMGIDVMDPVSGNISYIPGMMVSAGTLIDPQVSQYVVSDSKGSVALDEFLPPAPYASAPNLILNAPGLSDPNLPTLSDGTSQSLLVRGDLVIDQGASIELNPQISFSGGVATAKGGSLTLSGNTTSMLGSLNVPGGNIKISGAGNYPQNYKDPPGLPQVTVDLGPSSFISTAGEALYTHDPAHGLRNLYGAVLAGGSISVSGNILAEAGSVLDASGAHGVYDFFPSQLGMDIPRGPHGMNETIAYRVDSSGGSISLFGSHALNSDALLMAPSGGSTASGGSLSLSSGLYTGTTYSLEISQGSSGIPASFTRGSEASAVGKELPGFGLIGDNGGVGGGHVDVNSFANGGFDALTLSGNVAFNGPVSLALPGSISVASEGLLFANSTVNLSASYLSLGKPFLGPLAPGIRDTTLLNPPSYGSGVLNLTAWSQSVAGLIDVGDTSLQNIGVVTMKSLHGAIRGDGTLQMAGALSMEAAEIYPPTDTAFTVVANNYDPNPGDPTYGQATSAAPSPGSINGGSITVLQSGTRMLPLSAGGSISLFADTITQAGTLAAPFGVITLGSASGQNGPATTSLVLAPGSLTTISAVDPLTGVALSIPFGSSIDGTSWTDSSGTVITSKGIAGKSVSLNAQSVALQQGAMVDLKGGGAETAAQWISGLGGTLNYLASTPSGWSRRVSYLAGDTVSYGGKLWSARAGSSGVTPSISPSWTQLPQSYAIVPGDQFGFAPNGYGGGALDGSLLGSRITIDAGSGLPAGTYTLLPSSYATQPGAYLVSASSQSLIGGAVKQPDGSVLVTGIIHNGLDAAITPSKIVQTFEVDSPSVVAQKLKFSILDATTFFSPVATSARTVDAGNLVIQGISSMALNGEVLGLGGQRGKGASVDITSPLDFSITPDGTGGISGDAVLGASLINTWSFGSLLIGGTRGTIAQNGLTPASVAANNITLSPGTKLSGNDIILAANNSVTLGQGASVVASGSGVAPGENLSLTGNGALLRVSTDPLARDTRTGSDQNPITGIVLSSGNRLSGVSITLDSSSTASFDPSTVFDAKSINLSAGEIDLVFNGGSGNSGATVLSGTSLGALATASALNLTSYSSINFFGNGTLGGKSLASLSLHAGEIEGDGVSSDSIQASSIQLDNANGVTDPNNQGNSYVPAGGSGNTLTLTGSILTLGAGNLALGGYQTVSGVLSGGILGVGTGGLTAGQDLMLTTPILTGAAGSVMSLAVPNGSLKTKTIGSTPERFVLAGGLGASLTLTGSSLSLGAPIALPSGSVTVRQSGPGTLAISSRIDVGGTAQHFFKVTKYTDAGFISLSSAGSIALASGAELNLSAQPGAGSAGSLSIVTGSSASDTFSIDPSAKLSAVGGKGGQNGSFSLDVGVLPALSALIPTLNSDGFTQSLSFHVRNGDVAVDTVAKAHQFSLSTDQGSIDVTGTINASGLKANGDGVTTGGSISLVASGSVTLDNGSLLTVHADDYDAAGKGGSVLLSAGAEVNGQITPEAVLDLQSGSKIDLGVNAHARSIDAAGDSDQFSGTLHLRAPLTVDAGTGDATGIKVAHLASQIIGGSSIALEGYMLYDITGDTKNGDIQNSIPLIQGLVQGGQSVASQIAQDIANFYGSPTQSQLQKTFLGELQAANPSFDAFTFNMAPGVEIINRKTTSGGFVSGAYIPGSGDLVLNNDWDLSTLRAGPTGAPGFLTLRAGGNLYFRASLSDGFAATSYGPYGSFLGSVYNAPLMAQSAMLPANFQSWSYQLTGGGDLSAADTKAAAVGAAGNVMLGIPGQNFDPTDGQSALTAQVLLGYYQVIRTGTGDINVNAAGSLQLWNQFASIYTAGVQVTDPSLGGTFDTPIPYLNNTDQWMINNLGNVQQVQLAGYGNTLAPDGTALPYGTPITQLLNEINGYQFQNPNDPSLGNASQIVDPNGNQATGGSPQVYPAQFSYAGGNINVNVGGDISHLTLDGSGNVIADSVREMPNNWLYRRGATDPTSGNFAVLTKTYAQYDSSGNLIIGLNDGNPIPVSQTEITSTAWWVDFSNFFEGVGALGSGNISMHVGGSVNNVDAVIPTQSRMTGTQFIPSGGMSLGQIAQQVGIPVDTLAGINGSTIGTMQPAANTTLSIPDANGDIYTVNDGDTLASIAAKFGVTPGSIASANPSAAAGLITQAGTQVRVPVSPSQATVVETGGGDIQVTAGGNINAGVYYVERGNGTLKAGGGIITNPTRDPVVPTGMNSAAQTSDTYSYLPTTLFLGKGSFDVKANGSVLLGPVANAFLMPQGVNNSYWYQDYFSTYAPNDAVNVSSLAGSVTFRESAEAPGIGVPTPILELWMNGFVPPSQSDDKLKISYYQPWLRLDVTGSHGVQTLTGFGTQMSLLPPTMTATAFTGDITLQASVASDGTTPAQGGFVTMPSPVGTISLLAHGGINGMSAAGASSTGGQDAWTAAEINLSDANPALIPTPFTPQSPGAGVLDSTLNLDPFFAETGSYIGVNGVLQKKLQLHDSSLLHAGDSQSLQLIAETGNISGLTLFSAKQADVVAGGDITDVGLYIQNNAASDFSIVSAGGSITAWDSVSPLQQTAQSQNGQNLPIPLQSGDIQISGPGTLEVLAGANVDLGNGPNNADGTGVGISSIGNNRNPVLPFQGADLVIGSGLYSVNGLALDAFAKDVISGQGGTLYLSELADTMTYSGDPLSSTVSAANFQSGSTEFSEEERAKLELQLFYIVLRDTGRNYNKSDSPGYRSYENGKQAIRTLLGNSAKTAGNITMWSRDIRTKNGGNIDILAPNGGISLASIATGSTLAPPGIITEHGGGIDIYTRDDVSLGIGRIFTLRGGDIMIWSDQGNIAAGASAKTVASAPPTEVLIDPQSGNVETDLSGLATGGGIGVLATVLGVPPGNVDLIAPIGFIDAGDAGIRSSGNLNLAATKILNADNIAATGSTSGAPPAAPPPAALNVSGASAASAASAANNSAAQSTQNNNQNATDDAPSIISIDILGYGGRDEEDSADTSCSLGVAPQASL
jgi:filamentous hemagglutinin family protein